MDESKTDMLNLRLEGTFKALLGSDDDLPQGLIDAYERIVGMLRRLGQRSNRLDHDLLMLAVIAAPYLVPIVDGITEQEANSDCDKEPSPEDNIYWEDIGQGTLVIVTWYGKEHEGKFVGIDEAGKLKIVLDRDGKVKEMKPSLVRLKAEN